MKSGAPWHIKGVRRDTVENAREAARRAGVSVGEWLNSVVRESAVQEPDDEEDIYDDPYAPPSIRRAREDNRGPDISVLTQTLEGLTGEVKRLARVTNESREEVPQYDATAKKLADAIARLDGRVENFMVEGRSATQALGVKFDSVDRALSELGRERARAGASDWSSSVDQAVDEITQRQRELEREGFAPPLQPRMNGAGFSRDDLTAVNEQLRRVAEQVETFGATKMREAVESLRNDLADVAGKLTEASPRRAIEALENEVRALASQLASTRTDRNVDLSSIESGLAEVRNAIRALTPAESLSGAVDAIHILSQKIDQMASGAQDTSALQELEAAIAGLRTIVSRVASDDSLAALTAEVRTLSEKIGNDNGAASSNASALLTLEQRISTIADAIESVRISTASPGSSALEAAIHSLGEKIERLQPVPDRSAEAPDLGAMIGSLGDRIERMHAASDPLAGNSQFEAMIGSLSEKIEKLQAAPDRRAEGPDLGAMIGSLGERIEKMQAASAGSLAGNSQFANMIGSLGEKIERLQASRGDDAVLRQIEQRIGALSEKLEASEAKLGNLDSIDRGMKDLLAYLEGQRAVSAPPPAASPPPVETIVQDVRKTQESLEAAHGTIGDVVDRLAIIETGMRSGNAAPIIPAQAPTPETVRAPAKPAETSDLPSVTAPSVAPAAASNRPPLSPQAKASPAKPVSTVGDFLPHDFPLEPGSGKPSAAMAAAATAPGHTTSPAERIAASKAVVQSSQNAAADSDAKLNFIVAARRAAQAAAEDDSVLPSPRVAGEAPVVKASGARRPSRLTKYVKPVLVGASIIVIIAGALHLAAGFLNSHGAPKEASGSQSNIVSPETAAQVSPPAMENGGSGVLTDSNPGNEAGVLPPGVTIVRPGPVAPSNPPEASPPATPTSPRSDVTGAVVPQTSLASPTPVDLFPAPQEARAAPLPAAIGSKKLINAAEAGDATAAFEVATRFADGRGVPLNPEAAAIWFERAARGGLVPGIFRLGGAYEKGIGIKKDIARARELYTAAAERGNAKAMHNLAVLYADGAGEGKPDYPAAIQWFRMAAARGVPDSQYNLGVLYARGIGVEQNFGEFFRWFALAAQTGDQDAAQKRDDVAKRLDGQTLSAMRSAVQGWTPELQPDDAVTVKAPAGGWDSVHAPPSAKGKSKRVQSGRVATTL